MLTLIVHVVGFIFTEKTDFWSWRAGSFQRALTEQGRATTSHRTIPWLSDVLSTATTALANAEPCKVFASLVEHTKDTRRKWL